MALTSGLRDLRSGPTLGCSWSLPAQHYRLPFSDQILVSLKFKMLKNEEVLFNLMLQCFKTGGLGTFM